MKLQQPALKDFLDAEVHLGHPIAHFNPRNCVYVHSRKNGMHIINLRKTAHFLRSACHFLDESSKIGKDFIFIGTQVQASEIVKEEATKCGVPYINGRWIGGTFTNWSTIRKRVKYLNELNKREENGEFDSLSKKEAAAFRRKRDKLIQDIGGIVNMRKIPDIAVLVDPRVDQYAVNECRRRGMKIVAFLDTNCNADVIDFPIPANNDSFASIRLILSTLSNAILIGKEKAEETKEKSKKTEGRSPRRPEKGLRRPKEEVQEDRKKSSRRPKESSRRPKKSPRGYVVKT